MAKFDSKTIFAILSLIAALLLTSRAIRLQTGSTHLGDSVDLHSDGLRGPFANLHDQELRDNTTFSDALEPDFGYKCRLFFRERIHKAYNALWYLLGTVFVIVISLAVDHLTNFHRKEQMYLLFIMSTSLAYAIVAFWGISIHVFLIESTITKNMDIIISGIIQIYSGMVVIVYWWFLLACLDFTRTDLGSGSWSTYHHYHSVDLRFLMPEPFVFTPRKIKMVSNMLYLYILVRVMGMIICLLVVQYVPHEWHIWVELVIELLLLCYEVAAHYLVDLFFEAVHHDLPSPIFHKIDLYVLVLGIVSSVQEWLLKLLCVFCYVFGMGSMLMINDVPFIQNILLMLEVFPLAVAVFGRFTAATYLSFVLTVSSPDWRLSSKRN